MNQLSNNIPKSDLIQMVRLFFIFFRDKYINLNIFLIFFNNNLESFFYYIQSYIVVSIKVFYSKQFCFLFKFSFLFKTIVIYY